MMITEEFEERSQSLDLLVPTSILMIDTFPRFPPGIGAHLHTVFIPRYSKRTYFYCNYYLFMDSAVVAMAFMLLFVLYVVF